jgi:hypothetical protein
VEKFHVIPRYLCTKGIFYAHLLDEAFLNVLVGYKFKKKKKKNAYA